MEDKYGTKNFGYILLLRNVNNIIHDVFVLFDDSHGQVFFPVHMMWLLWGFTLLSNDCNEATCKSL